MFQTFHSVHELSGLNDNVPSAYAFRQLGKIETLDDVRKNVDSYDCGIWNADQGMHMKGFHYNIDFLPTIIDLLKDECGYHSPYEMYIRQMLGEHYADIIWAQIKSGYDGVSYAKALTESQDEG